MSSITIITSPFAPVHYGELLKAEDEPLKLLANRFSTLSYQTDAHSLAIALKARAARTGQRSRDPAGIQHNLKAYDSQTREGFQRLHDLLERQSYRLASWRTAADDINWRRFFDVNELGGLRVERPAVFEATHAKIFELVAEGLIDGLRIDHIDGLADPRGYCRKLRRRVDSLSPDRHLPIYVEKILGEGETLHRDWSVDGTTGYEFMNQLSLLQHDPEGAKTLGELWNRYSERPADFRQEAQLARQQILNGSLAGDFESVAQALLQVARDDLMTRDLTLGAIRRALQELIVHFPVYRTYISPRGRSAEDDVFFQQAMDGARQTLGEADWPVLDCLAGWLGGEPWRKRPVGRQRKILKHACVRFQQLTSPAAAKAVEDTAFYRSAVLLSRNDVGFSTEQFMLNKSDKRILQLGAIIAHEHHERWDGAGYPRGLIGEQIHIAGRIAALADVLDALVSRRCYKEPWQLDEALDYVREQAGTQFDPNLVQQLLDKLDAVRAIYERYPDA